MHGTSQAAPHVTGAIAQLLDAYSDVEGGWLFEWPEMVKAMLLASAVDVGGDTAYYGHGLLDAYHAIYSQPGVNEPMDRWGGSMSATRVRPRSSSLRCSRRLRGGPGGADLGRSGQCHRSDQRPGYPLDQGWGRHVIQRRCPVWMTRSNTFASRRATRRERGQSG